MTIRKSEKIKLERLKRWRESLAAKNITVAEAASRLSISARTAYNWNCGGQVIPEARVRQVEAF